LPSHRTDPGKGRDPVGGEHTDCRAGTNSALVRANNDIVKANGNHRVATSIQASAKLVTPSSA
jgi:hypothetical protein